MLLCMGPTRPGKGGMDAQTAVYFQRSRAPDNMDDEMSREVPAIQG